MGVQVVNAPYTPYISVLNAIKAHSALPSAYADLSKEDQSNLDYFLTRNEMNLLMLSHHYAEVSQYRFVETSQIDPKDKREESVTKVAIWRREVDSDLTIEGLILYPCGYYIGQMRKLKAEGEGKLYFLNEKMQTSLVVEGTWHNDSPKAVSFSQPSSLQDKLFSISTTSTANVYEVRFQNGDVYVGSLTFSAKSLVEMISGDGKIRFKNGDIYKGGVLNGMMHSFGRSSQFTSKDGMIYEGCFYKGKKQGRGNLSLFIGGEACSLQGEWRDNKPEKGTIKRKEGEFERSFKMEGDKIKII